MIVSFSEAARQLGYKTRASLYRCRDDGRLDGYLAADGRIEMEPDGRRPLAQHLREVLQPQNRNGGEALNRGVQEAELAAERTRKLKLENDEREGLLVEVAALQPVLHSCFQQFNDAAHGMPARITDAIAAGIGGLDSEQRHRVRMILESECDRLTDDLAKSRTVVEDV